MEIRNIKIILFASILMFSFYNNPAYSENSSKEISTEISADFAGSDSAGNQSLTASVNSISAAGCPPQAIFGQNYNAPTDTNWIAPTSDIGAGASILAYDNYVGSGSINKICFWGINGYFSTDTENWYVCYESPMEFEIKFYADNNGSPGAELSSHLVTCVGNQTGLIYRGVFELYAYYAELEQAIDIEDGWISIQGQGDRDDCWFEWMSSGSGLDDAGYQWDGTSLNAIKSDRAFCLQYQNYICGDIDGDNFVSIFDVIYFINYKYKNGPDPISFLRADINRDGYLNIIDIVYILMNLYKDGPALVCP